MDDIFQKTGIAGVYLINRPVYPDDRGFFHETFRKNELEEIIGEKFDIVQQNHSRSVKNTLRGIHVAPWSKLIYVPRGKVQQVVVDLRKDSPDFGKWISVTLGEENKSALFVPPGCGNAFLVLSEECDYTYLVTDYWAPGKELSVIWNDSDLKIDWQVQDPVLSEKDQQNPTLKDFKNS
ncbi:MAG: dTDP-4-dehydrorhamnose 3,5-epimerase [Candidatus Daviesbacteria bacterium]|nr:dTDP-4-dehydrorhamnose 3,5-epimerase [Candidatus Daviesbacteria bacterium]